MAGFSAPEAPTRNSFIALLPPMHRRLSGRQRSYQTVKPPSITTAWPVMNRNSSLAR